MVIDQIGADKPIALDLAKSGRQWAAAFALLSSFWHSAGVRSCMSSRLTSMLLCGRCCQCCSG